MQSDELQQRAEFEPDRTLQTLFPPLDSQNSGLTSDAGDDSMTAPVAVEIAAEAPKGNLSVEDTLLRTHESDLSLILYLSSTALVHDAMIIS